MLTSLLPSPLFPYTTLFRSSSPASAASLLRELAITRSGILVRGFAADFFAEDLARDGATRGRSSAKKSAAKPDRKSTRLNSSHRCISYAVFCLKKKKNTRHQ